MTAALAAASLRGASEHVYGDQERVPGADRLREDQDVDPDPEPDRDPEALVRALPADARPRRRTGRTPGCSRSSSPSSRSPTCGRTARSSSWTTRSGTGSASAGAWSGCDKLGKPCSFCAATIITDPRGDREVHCPKCGHFNENRPVTCETCDEPVALKLKYDVDECQERGMTFRRPPQGHDPARGWDKDPETGAKTIRDIKEQEVYFGDVPLMTENGTFIINGTERVIVSQLHRSPGVFFTQPLTGTLRRADHSLPRSWVEFELDAKNLLYVRIDRKRKLLASVFLRALGNESDAEILKRFYKCDPVAGEGRLFWKASPNLVGTLSKAVFGPKDASGKRDEVVHAGKKITAVIGGNPAPRRPGDRGDGGRPRGRLHRGRHRGPPYGRGGAGGQRGPLAPRGLWWSWPRAARSTRSRCSSPSATRSSRCSR